MIKSINGSRYVIVNGGMPADPYISPGSSGAGMLRWNPNMHGIEVNDGNSWIALRPTHVTVDLSAEAAELLDWAREKRQQEQRIKAMAVQYPAVADALRAWQKANDQLDLVYQLCKSET